MLQRIVIERQNLEIFRRHWLGVNFIIKEILYKHPRVNGVNDGVIESITLWYRDGGQLEFIVRGNPDRRVEFGEMFTSRIRAEEWEGAPPAYHKEEGRGGFDNVCFSPAMPIYSSHFFRMIYSIQPDVAQLFPQLRVDIPELRADVLEQGREVGDVVDVQARGGIRMHEMHGLFAQPPVRPPQRLENVNEDAGLNNI